MDAAGVEHAAVVGESGSAPVAIHIAARHPDRVDSLVIVNGYARFIRDDDYPEGFPERLVRDFLEANMDPDAEWESSEGDDVALLVPSFRDDPEAIRWWVRAGQRGASPATARAIVGANAFSDVRDELSQVRVPTLVVHRIDVLFIPPAMGRYVADHIDGSRWVEVPGADNVAFAGDADALLDEVEVFLTGSIGAGADRALTTVLFTDIVDSTTTASTMGDHEWRAILDRHDLAVRAALRRFGGREVNTTGDGFVGTFDTPTQAVRGAQAIVDAAAEAGVTIRAGMHTGEVERRGDDVAGIAVHLAARVGAKAGPGEIWVSRTVRDLVTGTAFRFVDRGEHELKGISEPWQLFRLET
jgi:class 3 adenylate cyclase